MHILDIDTLMIFQPRFIFHTDHLFLKRTGPETEYQLSKATDFDPGPTDFDPGPLDSNGATEFLDHLIFN